MEQTRPRTGAGAGRKEITTRMEPDLAASLRRAAGERGVTVNDFIVTAVKAELEQTALPRSTAARRRLRDALLAAVEELVRDEEADEVGVVTSLAS